MEHAHRVHQRTLDAVRTALQRLHIPHTFLYRGRFRSAAGYDLVVSVGGDGTLLQVAHAGNTPPLLGVNSDPARSEAVFCAATPQTFQRLLRQALAGQLRALALHRLRVRLNRRVLHTRVLNDVLIAHPNPATMSRYRLRIGKAREDQKSSGLWVATAAGSSSAILAAGGHRLPWTARRYQYRPRELYQGRLTHGRLSGSVLSPGSHVDVTWLTRDGALFIDGPHVRYPLRFGDRVVVDLSPAEPLHILGLSRRHLLSKRSASSTR